LQRSAPARLEGMTSHDTRFLRTVQEKPFLTPGDRGTVAQRNWFVKEGGAYVKSQGVTYSFFALATLLLAAPMASAIEQTKAQGNCILKINKDGVAVQKRQGKIQAECVKRKTNNEFMGNPTGTEVCVNNDLHDKLVKNKAKTTADDGAYCGGLAAPDFGHTDAGTVNTAAVDAERNLIHDIFGANLDTSLKEKDPFADIANCQRGVHKRVEQYAVTLSSVFRKCKNEALEDADDVTDLEACVLADVTLQFDKRKKKILDWIDDKCDPFMDVSETSFPGVCNGLNDEPLRDCLVAATECRVCEMLNQMDGLAVNCDVLVGIDCP